jgi:hypothetical protein
MTKRVQAVNKIRDAATLLRQGSPTDQEASAILAMLWSALELGAAVSLTKAAEQFDRAREREAMSMENRRNTASMA